MLPEIGTPLAIVFGMAAVGRSAFWIYVAHRARREDLPKIAEAFSGSLRAIRRR
ncbi:hypothetical protein AB0B85_05500 [Micromonospora sp. NPDC049044]|uniref:H+/Cl- antiporter ClcA n=1 Tax=Micromonospora vinacea TaxID=709878 RepID=A0ABS0JXR3_9ACTN|nr:hypothetical protein [Micromonospora vinacea]MBG6101174.1 H+/Cl- antiporter ClcA [Micromonospora vinacea]